jgi:hypothetical protein
MFTGSMQKTCQSCYTHQQQIIACMLLLLLAALLFGET